MEGQVKIGINAFGCDHGRSGFGSYLKSFIRNISDFGRSSLEIFGPEIDRYVYTSDLNSVQYAGVPVSDSPAAEKLWHLMSYQSFVRKRGYNAVVFPAGISYFPVSFEIPAVVIIQSLFSEGKSGGELPSFSFLKRFCFVSEILIAFFTHLIYQ